MGSIGKILRKKITVAAQKKGTDLDTGNECVLRGEHTGEFQECLTCSSKVRLKKFQCPHNPGGVTLRDCKYCDQKVKSRKAPPSNTLDMFLSNRCNLRCFFCYVNDSKCSFDPPDREMIRKTLDWFFLQAERLPKNTKLQINIFGGEPLVEWPELKATIEYVESNYSNRAYSMGIVTNVVLLNERRQKYLDDHKVSYQMSIDGNPIAQDIHRVYPDGDGTSKIVHENARRILKRNPKSSIRLTVSPRTVHLLFESVVYLHENLGAVNISPVHSSGVWWHQEDLKTYREQVLKLTDWWVQRIREGTWIHLFPIDRGMRALHISRTQFHSCGAGRGMICVDTKGNIWPCHRFAGWDPESDLCLGHIYHGGYTNISMWDRIAHLDADTHRIPSCKGCSARTVCQSFCIYETNLYGANGVAGLYPQGPSAHHNCALYKIYHDAWSFAHRTLVNERNQLYMKEVRKRVRSGFNHKK